MSDDGGQDDAGGEGRAADEADTGRFAHFTLRGERFEAKGMPADTAVEVGNYKAAVYQAARQLWLDLNPGRSNVPRGFEEAFDLRLVTVDPGSARPRVELNRPSRFSAPEFDEWFDVFGRGRDAITSALAAVSDDHAVPPSITPRTRNALRKMGSSLGYGEELEVGEPSATGKRATLDAAVWQTLHAVDEVLDAPAEEPVSAVGVIVEFDSVGNSFLLSSEPDGLRIQCQLPGYVKTLNATIREVMAEDGVTAPDVEVSGFAVREPGGPFRSMYNVLDIVVKRPFEEKRLRQKLEALVALPAGWRGPRSVALPSSVRRIVEQVLPAVGRMDVRVALAASPDGHAVFEWARGDVEYLAELEPESQMYLCIDHRGTGELEDWEVPFDQPIFEAFLQGRRPR